LAVYGEALTREVYMVDSDEPVIGSSEVKELEERVRELERIVERTTEENEILREALSRSHSKISRPILLSEDPSVADVLSKFAERLKGKPKPRAP
jgi:vacuolar-type H+-ATPase subunit I/STV1